MVLRVSFTCVQHIKASLNMPRRRTVIGMAVVLAAFVVVFLVQPEVLRQLSRSSRHQQLRYSGGEGVCARLGGYLYVYIGSPWKCLYPRDT